MYSSGNLHIPPWEKDMLVIGRVVEASWNKHVISMVITAVLLFQGKNRTQSHDQFFVPIPWRVVIRSIRAFNQFHWLGILERRGTTSNVETSAKSKYDYPLSIHGKHVGEQILQHCWLDTSYWYGRLHLVGYCISIYISWRNRSSP